MATTFAPETLIKGANIYDSYKKQNIPAPWSQIFKDAGLSYNNGNARQLKLQMQNYFGRPFPGLNDKHNYQNPTSLPFGLDTIEIGDFDLVYFTDCHFWPTHMVEVSDSFTILLAYIEEAAKRCNKYDRTLLVVCGGDAFDGASISRFPSDGWEEKPTIAEELEACKWHMDQIMEAASKAKDVQFHWTIGNHDLRLDKRLANMVPQFEGIEGFSIMDHFKGWQFHFSLLVDNQYYFIHNIHGGKHAAYNNVRDTATHTFTGHTHHLCTRRVDFLRDHAVAIEGGTLAPRSSPAFMYIKGRKPDWQEGFVIASVSDGKFGYQLVNVDGGCAWIEGEWWEAA